MSTFKILIIIINIILFILVFLNLYKEINSFSNREPFFESVKVDAKIQEDAKIQSSIDKVKIPEKDYPTGLTNINADLQKNPTTSFCIKASYNSAYSGSYVSEQMVQYILSRGCRFLDFEIYYMTPTNTPSTDDSYDAYIGYSTSKDAVNPVISNTINVSLFKMLKTVFVSAFTQQVDSKYQTTNTNDPLFVQLRIRGSRESKALIYTSIKKTLEYLKYNGYDGYFYDGPYLPSNSIQSIIKRVIFVFEEDTDDNNTTLMKNTIGKKFINLITNSPSLIKKNYTDVNIQKYTATPPKKINTTKVDVKDLTLVVPDKNTSNIDVFSKNGSFIRDYGYQIVAFQYYNLDNGLLKHEEMFKHYNAGIVPMAYLLNYLDTYTGDNSKL
jgi:hypothetical protein